MELREQLVQEIYDFPERYLEELRDFIQFLRVKKIKSACETALLSEKSLSKDWLTPEEDEAWKEL